VYISTRTHTHTYTAGRIDAAPEFLSSHTLLPGSPLYLSFLPSFLPPFLPSFILYPSSIITTTIRRQQQHRPPWQSERATDVIVGDGHATALRLPICFFALPRPAEPGLSAFISSWGLDDAQNCSAPASRPASFSVPKREREIKATLSVAHVSHNQSSQRDS